MADKPKQQPKPETRPDAVAGTERTDAQAGVVAPSTAKAVAVTVVPSDKQRALEALRPSEENSIALPRIVVLQSKSREVEREEDPLKPGLLFNRLTKEVVGDGGKTLDFIPLMYFPQRIRIELSAGLRCRSIDLRTAQMMGGLTVHNEQTDNCGLCKLKEWPRDRMARGEVIDEEKARRGPECSLVENFPALWANSTDPSEYELILLSFSRTSIQAAKDLRGIHAISGKDWWTNKYKLVAVRSTGGPKGDMVYYKQEVRRAGKSSEQEQARAQAMLKFLAGRDVLVEDLEEAEGAAGEPAGDPAAAREGSF